MANDKVIKLGKKRIERKIKDIVKNETLFCSFCGRPASLLPKILKGPGVNICPECALIAMHIFTLEDNELSPKANELLRELWNYPEPGDFA